MCHRRATWLAAALFVAATPALAVPRTVVTTADSGAGSLRQAILDANASGDVIDFDSTLAGTTITLTSGELSIGKSLTITTNLRVTVSGNRASRVLEVLGGKTVSIVGLTIRDGSAAAGGGIANAGTLSLDDVTVTENRAPSGGGGGIRNSGTLTAQHSTISYNVAAGSAGGGIDNVAGTATLTNCTVSGNIAENGGGAFENAGLGGTLSLVFTTVAFNSAGGVGGGVLNSNAAADVTLQSSILWGNRARVDGPNCSATVTSNDYNLVGDAAGCTVAGTTTHNRTGDPHLGALQHNGGTVPTHPLRAGSDAMDQVPSGSCGSSGSLDARHLSRPRDGTGTGSTSCDIGAYEAAKPIVVDNLGDGFNGTNCQLRYAITAADTHMPLFGCTAGDPDANRITFAVTGTIRNTDYAQFLPQSGNLLIEGPGASRLTISGEGRARVFSLGNGAGAYGISGVTIASGSSSPSDGGGIIVVNTSSTIAIDGVAFEDDISGNQYGGSVAFDRASSVEIDASSFRNAARSSPGADVYASASNVTIRSSTIGETRSDAAVELHGSFFQTAPAHLRLIGCTVRGSEPSGLKATTDGTPDMAVLEVQGSVVAGHGADFFDAGVFDQATFVSRGDNVIGDGTGPALQTGDVENALASTKLADHLYGGGETKTIAPLPGSVLIDRIPFIRCPGTLDQRGVPRPLDGDRSGTYECDAGAFETAPPIVVNSLLDTADVGKCRLRDAVAAANTNASVNGCSAGLSEAPDLITFSVNGTVNLTSQLALTSSAAVRGPGATRLTLSGQGTTRVFNFSTVPGGDYAITGLTIANGNANFGAGVEASSTHTTALSEVMLRNNLATSDGGALYAQSAGAVQISRSTLTNPSGSSQSLLKLANASGELESSTVNDAAGPVSIDVLATGAGGAATLLMKSSTVSGSDAVGVKAESQGGAAAADARVEYSKSIFQGHGVNFDLTTGLGRSRGDNMSSDGTGIFGQGGDQPGVNPQLGPLGYHGGETPVFNLKFSSPAVDSILPSQCGALIDQRGFSRPVGSNCDKGAVERRPGGDVNADGHLDVGDVFFIINFLFASGPVPMEEGDMNGDGAFDVADVFYLINYLFASGPAPV